MLGRASTNKCDGAHHGDFASPHWLAESLGRLPKASPRVPRGFPGNFSLATFGEEKLPARAGRITKKV